MCKPVGKPSLISIANQFIYSVGGLSAIVNFLLIQRLDLKVPRAIWEEFKLNIEESQRTRCLQMVPLNTDQTSYLVFGGHNTRTKHEIKFDLNFKQLSK